MHCWLEYFFVGLEGVVWISLHSSNIQMSWNDVLSSIGLNLLTFMLFQKKSGVLSSDWIHSASGLTVVDLFHQLGPHIGCLNLSPVFLYTNCSTRCTPVSSWSNRPPLSGGDSSCSWVFCSCTGPQGESYTQLEGSQSVSPVAIALIWNRVHSRGYSHERTQTSSFSCKVYWDTSSGIWSGVTAIQ